MMPEAPASWPLPGSRYSQAAPWDKSKTLIEITPKMIAAGVSRAKDFCLGASFSEVVEEVYLAMEIERRGY